MIDGTVLEENAKVLESHAFIIVLEYYSNFVKFENESPLYAPKARVVFPDKNGNFHISFDLKATAIDLTFVAQVTICSVSAFEDNSELASYIMTQACHAVRFGKMNSFCRLRLFWKISSLNNVIKCQILNSCFLEIGWQKNAVDLLRRKKIKNCSRKKCSDSTLIVKCVKDFIQSRCFSNLNVTF